MRTQNTELKRPIPLEEHGKARSTQGALLYEATRNGSDGQFVVLKEGQISHWNPSKNEHAWTCAYDARLMSTDHLQIATVFSMEFEAISFVFGLAAIQLDQGND